LKPASIKMGAQEMRAEPVAQPATSYVRRLSVLSLLRSRGKRKWRLLPKRGGAGKQSAKEIIAPLVAMVVLVALGVAYAANTSSSRRGSKGW
jgi:hypothetical protein